MSTETATPPTPTTADAPKPGASDAPKPKGGPTFITPAIPGAAEVDINDLVRDDLGRAVAAGDAPRFNAAHEIVARKLHPSSPEAKLLGATEHTLRAEWGERNYDERVSEALHVS